MTNDEIATLLEPIEAVAEQLDQVASTEDRHMERASRLRACLQAVIEAIDAADKRATIAEATLFRYGLAPGQLPTHDHVRMLGALMVDTERSVGIEQFKDDQRQRYAAASREHLEEELLRRDLNELQRGRQLNDGRVAGRLLRELMRGMLQLADAGALKQLESGLRSNPKGMAIDNILTMLGAEPADKRLLAESGTTLGKGVTPEDRASVFEELATGDMAHTEDTPVVRADVADSIRERRARQVPDPANPTPEMGD